MIPRLNRQKVLKEAKIVADGVRVTCLIENISESGAALILAEHYSPAARFRLCSPGMPERDCEVIWHRSKLVGVRFV
jgi:hypothetical protein